MLSERRWRLDAVLLLTSGLLFSICVGSALKIWMDHYFEKQGAGSQAFYAFIIGTLSFQGAGLLLLHFFLKLHEITWKDFLGISSETWKRAIKLAVVTALVAIPLTLLLNKASALIITHFSEPPKEQVAIQVLQSTFGWGQRLLFGIAALVLAPIVEEGLFRGVLYSAVKQYGYPMLALAGSSLFFAAIHGNLLTFVPLTVLAMIFVLLYEKTGGLVAPIVTHALFNAVNFSLFFILPSK